MSAKGSAVVQHLGDNQSLIGILVQFGFDTINVSITIDPSTSIGPLSVGNSLASTSKRTPSLMSVKRYAFRVVVNILLKVILDFKARFLDRLIRVEKR